MANPTTVPAPAAVSAAEPEPKDEVKEARGAVKAARQGRKARRLRARAKRIEERPTVYEKLQQMKTERGGTGTGMTIPPKELAALEQGLPEPSTEPRGPVGMAGMAGTLTTPDTLVGLTPEGQPVISREERVQEALERISAYREQFTQPRQRAKPAEEPTEASD